MMLLGCIGDDFTGSSDLANTLAKQGMNTVQYSGIPSGDAAATVEAGVVSLKSRSIAVADAVALSLEALEWLKAQGCQQYFFKYCSTFDSTPDGNIGPVAEALADALGADRVIACPAFPGTGRSIYQGHLFVKDRLLSESGMQNHPLTPMTDPDLRRWLARQCRSSVGHVAIDKVLAGDESVRRALDEQDQQGHRLVIVDALRDADLMVIGRAVADLPLLTGGSGVALGLPENFRQRGLIGDTRATWRGEQGTCVALSGSCSDTTRAQVETHIASGNPNIGIDAGEVMNGKTSALDTCSWLMEQAVKGDCVPLAYSSASPEKVRAVQDQFGREQASAALENFFAELARLLVEAGLSRLIVAGGETSGAVVEALSMDSMAIGPEIDPGVPAMRASDSLVFTLKSGNFGAADFFSKAAERLSSNSGDDLPV